MFKKTRGCTTYIEEDNIAIRVSIVPINPIESLRELNVTDFLSGLRIHHETHCFSKSFAIVDVVITVDVQKIRSV